MEPQPAIQALRRLECAHAQARTAKQHGSLEGFKGLEKSRIINCTLLQTLKGTKEMGELGLCFAGLLHTIH